MGLKRKRSLKKNYLLQNKATRNPPFEVLEGWKLQVGESGVIWTGFCFYRVGRFLIIRFVK
jgi:hypothetical protein